MLAKSLPTKRVSVPALKPCSDLVIRNARLIATVDSDRREIAGGWIAISGGLIVDIGSSNEQPPTAETVVDATDMLVTPGLVNTHHHLFQNLTRAYRPMTSAPLFGWLQTLYPLWSAALDEEAVNVAAWIGLAELALGGCTCLLYTSPSPRDRTRSRMPSSA